MYASDSQPSGHVFAPFDEQTASAGATIKFSPSGSNLAGQSGQYNRTILSHSRRRFRKLRSRVYAVHTELGCQTEVAEQRHHLFTFRLMTPPAQPHVEVEAAGTGLVP